MYSVMSYSPKTMLDLPHVVTCGITLHLVPCKIKLFQHQHYPIT